MNFRIREENSMNTIILIILIGISVLVAIKDFLRDLVIELRIRKGMDPKEARKNFHIKALLRGEYADLFQNAKQNSQSCHDEQSTSEDSV